MFCPFRLQDGTNRPPCSQDCALKVDGQCALVIIAEKISQKEENQKTK